jgi:regulator of sigma E protease
LTVVVGVFAFFVILAVLILVHELGHFTAAKLAGVHVDEFGLGFPPRLKSWRRGVTLYSLNAIPLGGFVKMRGENGEDAEPDSFGAKPPWQRLLILLAGPSMNLLLALAIFFFAFIWGSPRGLTVITKIAPKSPAAYAGLRVNDAILSVDGRRVQYIEDVQDAVGNYIGQRVRLTVAREGTTFSTSVRARAHPPQDQGAMGVVLGKTVTVRYGAAKAVRMSFQSVGSMIGSVPSIVRGLTQHTNQVSGPIGIAHVTTDVVSNEPSTGPGFLLYFVALLSANLGVLNLLPVPALDGGRIAFVLLSWVRRRNLDPEVEGLIHLVGMALLLMLILFVSYQDVARWVSGGSF